MNIPWQDILALVAVVWAAKHLYRTFRRTVGAEGASCGAACSGCSQTDQTKPLVSIDIEPSPESADRHGETTA